jgi:GDPmannose 4,6-dehydratase
VEEVNMSEKALITGITGQDGSYLAELLLDKGYEVHGIVRRGSTINTSRIDHLLHPEEKIFLHYGDLGDANSIITILYKVKPNEVYNIASMSHVRVSFDIPEYTGQITGLGATRILEALKTLNMTNVKYYQASSSEMFGISPPPQNENTPFRPQSPYGCAKLYAYWMTKAYRSGYKMFTSNGILFNHESPRRGETFVTKKIVRKAVQIKLGLEDKIYLGNLEAKRDWGFAGDYMEAIYKILHHEIPDDFVVATEEYHSIQEFAERVFKKLHLDLNDHIEIKDRYFRPNEVPELRGDATKIRKTLGWKPKVKFNELIDMMIRDVMKEEEQHAEIREIA